jgi:hypothetical protein
MLISVTHVLIIGADIGAAEAWSLRRLDLRGNRNRRDPDVHPQTWRVSTPPSAAFLDFLQQRTQHLLGQPSRRQLMNRCMCLIERGQERRSHGSVPEGHYRLVDGVRRDTVRQSQGVGAPLGSVIFAALAAGAMGHAT